MQTIDKKSTLFIMLIFVILTILNVKHKIQMSLSPKTNNAECV